MLQDAVCLFLGLGLTYTTGRLAMAAVELRELRQQVSTLQRLLGSGPVAPLPREVFKGRPARETWAMLRADRAARLAARGRLASARRPTL